MFRTIDAFSEGSEIVDAFFRALPKDIQKKWYRRSRGLIDQAGQYGIEGADWKLQALWHNWHRLDLKQAIINASENEIEDLLIGNVARRLPPGAGGVVSGGLSREEKLKQERIKRERAAARAASFARRHAGRLAREQGR